MNKRIIKLCLLFCCLGILVGGTVRAETISQYGSSDTVRKFSVGLLGGYSLDMNLADNLTLPGVPSCCGGYNGGVGGGMVGGLGFELPVSNALDIMARLTFHSSGVTQTSLEPVTVRDANATRTGNITHTLTTSVTLITLEPIIGYNLSPSLVLLGGLRLGTLMGGTYDQKEELDPALAYSYTNGTGVRNAATGDFLNPSSFQMGLLLGARYNLPLNTTRTFVLTPEVQFVPMFTGFIGGESWSASSVRLVIGLNYSFISIKKEATPLLPNK